MKKTGHRCRPKQCDSSVALFYCLAHAQFIELCTHLVSDYYYLLYNLHVNLRIRQV